MSDTPGPTTVTVGDYTVTSTTENEAQIAANLAPDGETPDLSKAASELGKEGGKASASARKEAEGEPDEAVEAKRRADDEIAKAEPTQKKRVASDRVEEATREAAAVKRQLAAERQERERERAELAQLRAERQGRPQAQEPPATRQQAPQNAPQADSEPKPEDYEDYGAYVKELGRYSARQEFKAQQQQARIQSQAHAYVQSLDSQVTKYNERIGERSKTDPGFMERVAPEVAALTPTFALPPGQRPGPQNVIADELLGSEKAPALMLHFTEHPDVFQRIAALGSPQAILREMARLEARLEVATHGNSTTRPQVSRATPPVRPVTGAPHTAESVPGEESSYEDHKRYWLQKDKRAQR